MITLSILYHLIYVLVHTVAFIYVQYIFLGLAYSLIFGVCS